MKQAEFEHQKPNGEWVDCFDKEGRCKRPQRPKRKGGKKSGLLQSNEKVSDKLETLVVDKESLDSFTELDYDGYKYEVSRLQYLDIEDTSSLYPENVVYEIEPEEYMKNSVDFLVDYYNSSPETQEQFYNMLENVVEKSLNDSYSSSDMYSDDFNQGSFDAPEIPDALKGIVYSNSGQDNFDNATSSIVDMYFDNDDEDKKALNDYLEIEWDCYDDDCEHEDCYIENFNTKKFANYYGNGEFAAAFLLEHEPHMINKNVIIEMEKLTRTNLADNWDNEPNATLFVPFILKNKDLISKYNKEKGLNFNIDKNVDLLNSKYRNIEPNEDIW